MTASRSERSRPAAPAESPAPAITVGDQVVGPGERRRIDLPTALLPTHTRLDIPLTVLNGRHAGPRLWISAAVHGDELNGVEIIRRALGELRGPLLRGALIAAPVVNVFGFIGQSRYLPDRRDLNRVFPGSRSGSLASRIAHRFLTAVVEGSTHGLDLHTAAKDRSNLPQTRGNMDDPRVRAMAEAFGAPVMLQSEVVAGSLRAAATKRGIPMLVYEAGEAQRFDEDAIATGVRGVLRLLAELGMTARRERRRAAAPPLLIRESSWIRARRGGLLRLRVAEGRPVEAEQEIGSIADPFGEDRVVLRAPFRGLVIGRTKNPVVHGGDAVLHLGRLEG